MITKKKIFFLFYLIHLFYFNLRIFCQNIPEEKKNIETSDLLAPIEDVRKDIEKENERRKNLFSIRLLGGVGYSAGDEINIGVGSLVAYEGSFQFTYSVHEIFNIGISTGYFHAYKAIFDELNIDTKKEKLARPVYGEGIQNFTYVQFFFDFVPSIFIFQLGVGPYISLKENSLNRPYFGMDLKLGIEFPIVDFISIPLLTQFQFVLLDKNNFIIPIKFFFRTKIFI